MTDADCVRRIKILNILTEATNGNEVTLEKIREELSKSGIQTKNLEINKDIKALIDMGFIFIKHTWGGIRTIPLWKGTPHPNWMTTNVALRRRIGRAVARELIYHVQETGGELTIALGSGTTTLRVAEAILDLAGDHLKSFNFATNNIEIIFELIARKKGCLVLGGSVFREQAVLVGRNTASALEQFIPSISIIGINGIRSGEPNGCFATYEVLLAHKKAMISSATKKVIIVADHHKIGGGSAFQIFSFEEMKEDCGKNPGKTYTLYTNKEAAKDKSKNQELDQFKKEGLEVKLV